MEIKVILVLKLWFLLASVHLGQQEDASHFCYNTPSCDPEHWGGVCKTGTRQSPIDLSETLTKKNKEPAKKVSMTSKYCHAHENYTIRNNGHSIEIHLADEAHPDYHAFSGDGFSDDYVFSQIHLHWGPTDDTGTEHAIDKKRYAMEMHIVHMKWHHKEKTFYGSESADSSDKIAVVGIIFETADSFKDNPALKPIIDVLQHVNHTAPDKIVALNGTKIDFMGLFPNDASVYRYKGSLTTPPCAESVLWTVFKPKAQVSKKQLQEIRSLLMPDGTPFKANARPLQPFNNRGLEVFPFKILCQN